MKKISLKNLNLKEVEQLSREQLKNVLGGFTGSGSDAGSGGSGGEGNGGDVKCNCSNKSDCPTKEGEKNQDCMNSGCDTSNGKYGTCGASGTVD